MLENRPLVVIVIGYIIGIIMGLYFNFSIVFLYALISIIYFLLKEKPLINKLNFIYLRKKIYENKSRTKKDMLKNKLCKNLSKKKFKLISIQRYSRYLKIIITKKVCLIFVISSIISNSITLYQNNKYDTLYSNLDNQDVTITGIVISNCIEKEYKNTYKIKVESVNNNEKYKSTYIFLNIEKQKDYELKYGQKVLINGTFSLPSSRRNYRGFDYREYLKTKKIYGIVDLIKIESFQETQTEIFSNNEKSIKLKFLSLNKMVRKNYENSIIKILKCSNTIFLKIKNLIQDNFKNDVANVILGVTLGYTDEMDEETTKGFQESNSSHILAVSGMHVAIIIMFSKFITEKTLGKKLSKLSIVIFLLIYMFITGLAPSIVRACITSIIVILSFIFYRKSDIWESMAISLLILLIYNPFLIEDISLLLSYISTISIIILNKTILALYKILYKKAYSVFCNILYKKNYIKSYRDIEINENKEISGVALALSATIGILPILSIYFNKIPITSLLIGVVIGFIITPIIILSLVFILWTALMSTLKLENLMIFVCSKKLFVSLVSFLTKIIIQITKIGENFPLNKIYVDTPSIFQIFMYYLIIIIRKFFSKYIYIKKIKSNSEKSKKFNKSIQIQI